MVERLPLSAAAIVRLGWAVSTRRSRVSEMDGRCYNPPVMMRYLRERGEKA